MRLWSPSSVFSLLQTPVPEGEREAAAGGAWWVSWPPPAALLSVSLWQTAACFLRVYLAGLCTGKQLSHVEPQLSLPPRLRQIQRGGSRCRPGELGCGNVHIRLGMLQPAWVPAAASSNTALLPPALVSEDSSDEAGKAASAKRGLSPLSLPSLLSAVCSLPSLPNMPWERGLKNAC